MTITPQPPPSENYSSKLARALPKKNENISSMSAFFRTIAQYLWNPGSFRLLSANITTQAKGLRQQASIKDFTDYNKLNPAEIKGLLASISTEKELLHFCLIFNPTRLAKANIIDRFQAETLNSIFDEICERNPEFLPDLINKVRNSKNPNDITIDNIFKATVQSTPPYKTRPAVRATIEKDCKTIGSSVMNPYPPKIYGKAAMSVFRYPELGDLLIALRRLSGGEPLSEEKWEELLMNSTSVNDILKCNPSSDTTNLLKVLRHYKTDADPYSRNLNYAKPTDAAIYLENSRLIR